MSRAIVPEPWRWSRPRVLVEHPDEAAGLAIAEELRFAGYAVALCAGPRHTGECPLVADGCVTARDADAAVCCLGYERAVAREVLSGLRARCPGVPLVVEAPAHPAPELAGLLEGCHTLAAPAAPRAVADAVDELLGRRGEALARPHPGGARGVERSGDA